RNGQLKCRWPVLYFQLFYKSQKKYLKNIRKFGYALWIYRRPGLIETAYSRNKKASLPDGKEALKVSGGPPLGSELLELGGGVVFFNGLDQVFAFDAQPHGNGGGHEYRRINAKPDADGQRQREVVQSGAAEEEHRQHHHLGRPVGNDGSRD